MTEGVNKPTKRREEGGKRSEALGVLAGWCLRDTGGVVEGIKGGGMEVGIGKQVYVRTSRWEGNGSASASERLSLPRATVGVEGDEERGA